MSTVVAAFDVDGTLTVRDCVVPFMRKVSGTGALVTRGFYGMARRPTAVIARDRDEIKAFFVKTVFAGRLVHDVEEMGTNFAETVSRSWMRPDVLRRLRWHQARGHRTVLVSASLGPYLRALGSRLSVDAVLCTELEHDGRVFSGSLEGVNCRGPEKSARLDRWLAGQGLGTQALEWAYGDSTGDREMLAAARHGINVRRIELSEWPH